MTTIVEHEAKQMNAANASGRPPVVFIHGLWLLPCSWDRWAALFEEAGDAVLTPGWPDEPETALPRVAKIPAPMIAPIPSATRSTAVSVFFSPCASSLPSSRIRSSGFLRK